MKSIFDDLSRDCSKLTTNRYSTSFSLGILFLSKAIRSPIYSIYGFVRLADEIVDSFHGYNKESLLRKFRKETFEAISNRISLNPILNSFQEVVYRYGISHHWINTFLDSMEMDLYKRDFSDEGYNKYILGSAEVVGLMCLHVFTEGDEKQFEKLKPHAMRLGAAFQKVNFLRDIKADKEELGRTYFPGVDTANFVHSDKKMIELQIENDFSEALKGIRMLPDSSRNGVYLAYYYYTILFRKIKQLPAHRILNERIRIPDYEKIFLMFKSNIKYKLNLL